MVLRRPLVLLHRCLGIALAVLLVPAAVTGSALVWKPELDRWLNPTLFRVAVMPGVPLDEQTLMARVRQSHPEARIRWAELPLRPGDSALLSVTRWPHPDPDHRIDQVFVDPFTGAVLGARSTVTPGLNRAELMHFVRRFHYTLMLKRTGMLIMGGAALLWSIDCFGGVLLTLPRNLRRWRKWRLAWQVKPARLNFDLHRAGGLWLWPVLLVLATSGVYLNLAHEVFVPVSDWLVHRLLPERLQTRAAEAVLEWQYPLHTGEAFGLPGRLVVFAAGFAIVALALTGLVTTQRKLRPRRVPPCESMAPVNPEPNS